MNFILDKDKLVKLCEAYTLSADDIVWIHHPITEDLINVKVIKSGKDKVLVSILDDSPYFGQPDWWMSKLKIIGIK